MKAFFIRFPLHVPILTDYFLIVSRKKTGFEFVLQTTIGDNKTGKIRQQIKFRKKSGFFQVFIKMLVI